MVKGQPTDKELDDFFASLPEFSGGKGKPKSAKHAKKSSIKYATATTRAGKYRQLYEVVARCTYRVIVRNLNYIRVFVENYLELNFKKRD